MADTISAPCRKSCMPSNPQALSPHKISKSMTSQLIMQPHVYIFCFFINVTYNLGWSAETVAFHCYYSISIVINELDKILQTVQATNACSQTTWCTLRTCILVFLQPAKHQHHTLTTISTLKTIQLTYLKSMKHEKTLLTHSLVTKLEDSTLWISNHVSGHDADITL
jgi:hypothetical protein